MAALRLAGKSRRTHFAPKEQRNLAGGKPKGPLLSTAPGTETVAETPCYAFTVGRLAGKTVIHQEAL